MRINSSICNRSFRLCCATLLKVIFFQEMTLAPSPSAPSVSCFGERRDGSGTRCAYSNSVDSQDLHGPASHPFSCGHQGDQKREIHSVLTVLRDQRYVSRSRFTQENCRRRGGLDFHLAPRSPSIARSTYKAKSTISRRLSCRVCRKTLRTGD